MTPILRPENGTERQLVAREARTWIGTPYHPHGRVKGVGVDCAMLPNMVYAAVGLIDPRAPAHYPMDWHLHRDTERYLDEVRQVAVETEKPRMGDFVAYRFGRTYSHGGIVVDWPNIVHAIMTAGVVMARGDAGEMVDRKRLFFTLWGD